MTTRITKANLTNALAAANDALGLTDPDGPRLALYSAYGGHAIVLTGGPFLGSGQQSIGIVGCGTAREAYQQLTAITSAVTVTADPVYRTGR